ncbi:Pro-kumamolisin [Coniella lustricola]|uniref:tripeptidyl-peptidase II n=1 Tax=Coniella lustricola TaxID=2025994 RepID=A0A2T3ALG5_9PEZI|nr:Pro-kumamolisin [Coniella lustricola]
MRFNIITSVVATLAVAADAKPLAKFQRGPLRHVVHEEVPAVHSKWQKDHRMHYTATLPVKIGLAQQNLHRAEEFIYDVANPNSPNYGRHWSPAEVIEMFKPKRESVNAIMEWLESEGIHPSRVKLSVTKNWITFNATVREMEQMLKTEYHVYKHETQNNTHHVACEKYHVPDYVAEHVDIITPTVHFDKSLGHERTNKHKKVSNEATKELKRSNGRRQDSTKAIVGSPLDGSNPKQGQHIDNAMMDLSQCDTMITPDCLRALYNMPKGTLANASNALGIVEYTPQAFLQTDLDLYFDQFTPDIPQKTPQILLLADGVVQTQNQSFNFNGESALDLEFAMALISPQKASVYQVGDLVQGASFNNFLDGIDASYCSFKGGDSKDPNMDGQYSASVECGIATATNVISTSYGSNEADLGAKYERRQCDEYMKLALQGVTVLYSSGDSGVAGNGGVCLSADGQSFTDGTSGKFNPSFPGGCPWVTSVGATQLSKGTTVNDAETACQEVIFSGGGFSNVFAIPSYQKKAVSTFMTDHAPPYGADRFNNSGKVRAFPDVSANGANYVTAVDGQFSLSFGTSASAPVFASMINMINEERLQAGKSPVGFINEALYANPQVMNDITNGTNPGCGTVGFSAVKGWDPLTGLGTPNYAKMKKLFMTLP